MLHKEHKEEMVHLLNSLKEIDKNAHNFLDELNSTKNELENIDLHHESQEILDRLNYLESVYNEHELINGGALAKKIDFLTGSINEVEKKFNKICGHGDDEAHDKENGKAHTNKVATNLKRKFI